jgi:hypothetical protein
MLIVIVGFVAALIGVAVGIGIGLWLARRDRKPLPLEPVVIDAALENRIKQASAEWAAQQNRPEAAGLVAGKLRLLYRLNQTRRP